MIKVPKMNILDNISLAIKTKNVDWFIDLLRLGSNFIPINTSGTDNYGYSLLHYICMYDNSTDCIMLNTLIDCYGEEKVKSLIDKKDIYGYYPIHWSARKNTYNLISTLRKWNKNVENQQINSYNALDLAKFGESEPWYNKEWVERYLEECTLSSNNLV